MTELSKAEKVLKEFIIQMNQWELKYYPLFRNEGMTAYKDAAKKELDDIYDLFCTKKKENRAGKYRYHVVNHRNTHQMKKY
ncbi:Immunity protein RhsIA [Dickeya solani]|nr:NTF2 fold immunity protein [Dickeya solani]NUA47245.1 Immunity protein RhsIA [Dickeya solani]QKO12531.1 Immunity protein RhsIA [Dickeya solani]